jgi:hypothetical protein
MENKKHVEDFNSYIDHLLEQKNLKKGTEEFDRIKKNVLSFNELYENGLNEEGGATGSDKDKKKEEEKIPKDVKKRIEYYVVKAMDKDPKEVKMAGKGNSSSIGPWRAILDWMSGLGEPTKRPTGKGESYEPITDPEWLKKFKDRKTTMKPDDIDRCMQYWNGMMNSASGQEGSAIDILEKLTKKSYVINLLDVDWKNASENTIGRKPDILWGKSTDVPKGLKFDKDLIVEKSKILLEKAKNTFDKSGKTCRVNIGFRNIYSFQTNLATDENSLGLIPSVKFEDPSNKGYNTIDMFGKTNFFLWYNVISDENQFSKLLARLDDPKYIKTGFVKMTKDDKIKIITGINDVAKKKFAKKDYDDSGRAIWGIYGATSIMWWPKEAIETMPKNETPPTTTETPANEPTEIINTYDFAWPYSDKNSGKELAMTYFNSDQATIKDGKDKEIQNAVSQIMNEIKAKNGELLNLKYKIVASTSDEPSYYQQNGTLGSTATTKNNEYLVVARAKVIEKALNDAITALSINKDLVTKEGEELTPNNTLGGTAVYNTLKSKRGTEEYKQIMAKPKHSGILFSVEYITKEKINDIPKEEIEEEPVVSYSVVGEWLYEITWKGSGGSSSSRRRRKRSRKAIKGINWDKIFPDMPTGGGWGVDDLCDAYG